jgi:hypothetical protein
MIDISNPLLLLRDFLLLNFSTLRKVEDLEEEDTGDSTFIENYVQFLLETIVEGWIERKLNTRVTLPPYNLDGALFNSGSSRILCPEKKRISHEISCLPKNNEYFFDFRSQKNVFLIQNDQFLFCRFVTFSTPGLLFETEEPPFDYIVCVDKNAKPNSSIEVIFELKACDFYVQKVTEKFSTSYPKLLNEV